jgi:hypothetical protein
MSAFGPAMSVNGGKAEVRPAVYYCREADVGGRRVTLPFSPVMLIVLAGDAYRSRQSQ